MRRPAPWQDVPDAQWRDWRWQQRNRLTSLSDVEGVLRLSDEERSAFRAAADTFRVGITPYYAALMSPDDPGCPIRRQAIPSLGELRSWPGEREDPLAEESHMPVPGLTHRYPDRALLYVTHNCPVYCRFCTRKRKVGDPHSASARGVLETAIDYVRRTPQIRDVIVSGGDPLSLSNDRLGDVLEALVSIEHVDVVRLGTRNPVTLPYRIDDGLCERLAALRGPGRAPVWIMTHFEHPLECTEDAATACARLADCGLPIMNQMVLLKGVNDDAQTIETLNRALLRMRVKPYYLIHADMAEGVGHFRTTVDEGIAIMDRLRGWLSGLAVPQYVVDLPGGGGKVPVIPQYVLGRDEKGWLFRNYAGQPFRLDER